VVPGVPGPTLPIIPGNVVAQGYVRRLTADEKGAKKLIRKAARMAHVKPPKFSPPCVTPIVDIQSGADDPDYAIVVDDHCGVRITVWAQTAIGDDLLPVLPPGFSTAPSAASTSSVTPQSKMISYSDRNWPGECPAPATDRPSCGGVGYNRVVYNQVEVV